MGIYIHFFHVDGLIVVNFGSIMDYTMNGRIREHRGNRNRAMVLQDTYLCRSLDKWVSITIPSDKTWSYFSLAMGNPDWQK